MTLPLARIGRGVPADRRTVDETAMRTSHAATALVAFTAGLAVATTLRRFAGHRLPIAPAVSHTALSSVAPSPDHDAVVLPFVRPVVAGPAPQRLESPVRRCGESGGRTKAGAPCGARTTGGGRCHHHPIAA